MDKFNELFKHYPFPFREEEVSGLAQQIISDHYAENNNVVVWKQCLNQIDLTTLNGDDTVKKVTGMATHVNEFSKHYPDVPNVASICVYPAMVSTVHNTLKAPKVGITSVAAGFPASQTFIEVKIAEVALAIKEGATEIDVVLSIGKFLEGKYQEVYDELHELKEICGCDITLKVILETGALQSYENIYKASFLAMQAGADFIKTSTGKIKVNATPEATFVMCHAIKNWYSETGTKVGYKAAGGVASTEEAVQHYTIVKEILGTEWLNNQSFRFGASRLANNLLSSITGKAETYF